MGGPKPLAKLPSKLEWENLHRSPDNAGLIARRQAKLSEFVKSVADYFHSPCSAACKHIIQQWLDFDAHIIAMMQQGAFAETRIVSCSAWTTPTAPAAISAATTAAAISAHSKAIHNSHSSRSSNNPSRSNRLTLLSSRMRSSGRCLACPPPRRSEGKHSGWGWLGILNRQAAPQAQAQLGTPSRPGELGRDG